MMDSALIESIVRRVLSEASGNKVDADAPRYLVLCEKQHADELMIARSLPAGARVFFLDDVGEQWNLYAAHEYQGILLPLLTMNLMADLVVGRGTGKIGQLVVQLLLFGHRVEVLEFEYRAFEQTAPQALWHLYTSHQKHLEDFGLVERKAGASNAKTHRGHLITEKDVEQLAQEGVRCVQTGKRTIVTGLARDMARSIGMDIQHN